MNTFKLAVPLLLGLCALSGCQTKQATALQDAASLDKINNELKQAAQTTPAPAPTAVTESANNALLPPLAMPLPAETSKQLEHRFDLSVSDAPASQVFLSIVSGTRYNMLVHPEVSGNISVSLKDVTVLEALGAIRDLYGYEFQLEGNRILIQQAGIKTKLYKVNYIVGQRQGRSDITVTAGAGASSSGGSSSGSGGTQTHASSVASSQSADYWREIENSVRAVLNCGGTSSSSQASNTPTTPSASTQRSTTGSNTPASSATSTSSSLSSCAGKTVLVNPMSGTVFVRAMSDEIRLIDELLNAMQDSISRQVIIEAKIIDVELNSGAQQGINWAAFRHKVHNTSVGANTSAIEAAPGYGGTLSSGTSLNNLLSSGMTGTGGAFAASLGVALQVHNFSALINFLESQGKVNVLSSPRISTINNQKAVLKIGRDEQYVTGFESGSTSSTAGSTVTNQPTPVYSTFFSGISLDVTPQIDEHGSITLHVHPLVSEVTEVMKQTISNAFLPFASNKISETDSVVKVNDAEIIVIGGLMTESNMNFRDQIDTLGNLPVVGSLFRKLEQTRKKRELVILLKPTIVKNHETWQNEISASQQRIQRMSDHVSKQPEATP